MQIFNQPDDPCDRNDTTIRDGKITNTGATGCVLHATLTLSDKSAKPIELQLPASVIGDITYQDPVVSLDFHNVESPLFLKFVDDNDLQKEWGGTVLTMTATSTSVLVGTESGCIMLSGN
jgi:hypothetical protein